VEEFGTVVQRTVTATLSVAPLLQGHFHSALTVPVVYPSQPSIPMSTGAVLLTAEELESKRAFEAEHPEC